MRRTYASLVVALLVVVAGCAGAGGGGLQSKAQQTGEESSADVVQTAVAEATAAEDGAAESGNDAGASNGDAGDGGGAPAVQNRKLIRTAEVTLRVESFETARRELAAYARSTGGFVGDSTQQVHSEGNRTWTTGTITLRIPAANYSNALDVVNQTGEVRESSQQVRDVTDQVVDLEARLENLRAERDRLRQLYRRANDTEDVLAVQRELSRVQSDIERAEARLRQLKRKVAFTTIVVHLREPEPEEPEEPEEPAWYDTPVVAAFLDSVDGVIVFLRGTVVLAAYALPYLLVLGLPAAGGLFAVRRYRRRSSPDVPDEHDEADAPLTDDSDRDTSDHDETGPDGDDGDE
ncbi:MAG: DUF4349 domain-containing protein, partial [Halobaculum sp.]